MRNGFYTRKCFDDGIRSGQVHIFKYTGRIFAGVPHIDLENNSPCSLMNYRLFPAPTSRSTLKSRASIATLSEATTNSLPLSVVRSPKISGECRTGRGRREYRPPEINATAEYPPRQRLCSLRTARKNYPRGVRFFFHFADTLQLESQEYSVKPQNPIPYLCALIHPL